MPQKLTKKLQTELKFFSSFFKGFSTKSSFHGFRYIFCNRLHPLERLIWLFLIVLAIFFAFHISSKQYSRYIASPTVISLERDYREWNGTLPAITICYHKRIDEKKAEELIYRFWNVKKGEFSWFFDFFNFYYI